MASSVVHYFDLFITCVDKLGPMLKIWGQIDRVNSMFIEQLLKNTHGQFESEPPIPPHHLSKLQVGVLCCAKYKDGDYYRAQITNLRHIVSGVIEVKFIDYGNIELITIDNIRLLENVPIGLATMKPQAVDFILANAIHVNQSWDEKALAFVHQEISYIELKCTVVGAINTFRFLKVLFHNNDLTDYLVHKGIVINIPLAAQENILKGVKQMQVMQYTANMQNSVQVQRAFQPTQVQQSVLSTSQAMLSPAPELCSYKALPLEPNSEHMVYVSYVEDGPLLFSIQLQSMEDALTKLMFEINNSTNLLPLTEAPLPGHPCMARCLEDDSLCRAVVINLVGDKCKTFYVDFGNTDILPFSNIFQIPFKYMLPKVMSMRFTLAGLKNINVTNEMKCAFKEYVTNKLLKLKVLKLEESPVLQYCELYDEENRNIINVLYESTNQYKTLQISKGMKYNITVSFIEGCKKFFVQLKECSESLSKLMFALQSTCENSSFLKKIETGSPCVAFYSGDNQWYRAIIVENKENSATVKYVDYGNEETVPHNHIKKIDPAFVKILPAQAIECCLYGYQNMSFNMEIENVFQSITLECDFTMKVVNKQNNVSALLVDLFDSSGNNVAALLIEKLASQKSQMLSPGPLPANKVTRLISEEHEVSDKQMIQKSPKQETPSWRNSSNDKSWKSSPPDKKPSRNTENDNKKSWRNSDRNSFDSNSRKSWKNNNENNSNNRDVSQSSSAANSWNGDSPTNKRSQRPDRFRESNNKFDKPRRDKYENKFRSDRKSPQQNNNWNNSGSESEKSWSGNSSGNRSGKNIGNNKKDFGNSGKREFPHLKKSFVRASEDIQKKKPELPPQDLAPLEEPFKYPEINPGANETISISWFYNPENFYCQLVSQQSEFRNMMTEIQSSYIGRPPVSSELTIGASVIAEFSEDTILYRATIQEIKYPSYKVQYVDFGNMSWVDSRKIWQVEKKFMTLPAQAIKCGIINLKPSAEQWPIADEIDHIFNKDSFTAIFEGCDEEKYYIKLLDSEADVKQTIIDSGLGVDPTTAVQMADEPVDLNILMGQQIDIKMSNIDTLNKFYIQLEKAKASVVHEKIQSFMQSTTLESLQQFTEEQLIVGSTCLVKVEENIWKRGVITNVDDKNAVQISYPDFGGCGTYTLQTLYVLPPSLCAFWYQAFECSLHNLNDDTEKLITDEEFKEKYEGQNLIIYVDEIFEGRLFVTLYDKTGQKLNLIKPDEVTYSTVEPICPMPILNSTLNVWVTHVNGVNSIYLQRKEDGEKIAELLNSLFEAYDGKEEEREFKEGDYCSAKSVLDENWYRGKVLKLEEEMIKVLYIDYGNSETLPKNNLKSLDLEIFGMPELALQVSLNLKSTSDELTNTKLTELTTEKEFSAYVYYGETEWIADLIELETNTNLIQTLIDQQLASRNEETPVLIETITEESELIQNSLQEIRALVTITHIDTPGEFYVQLVSNQNSINELQAYLASQIETLPDLESPDLGIICAAKYTIDEQWYRAEILDADTEITTIRFIDYGNTDVITNNTGSIKTLPPDLIPIDKYARKCSLNISSIKEDEWPQEAIEMFQSAVNADEIYADIVYQDEKNKTFVDLYVNAVNVAEQLIEANLAVPITRDEEDSIANNTGFVSHLNSLSEFWIQLESSVPDLEMIVDRLALADSFENLQDFSPGVLCAANFPDDEMWYRARILSNTVAGIEVLFVDYGNSSTALKLKVLPEDLVQLPTLAQKCCLNKPLNIESWSEAANQKFREISGDGATIFTIKKLSAGETSAVELFIEGQNILDQLIEFCAEGTEIPQNKKNLTKVLVTYGESPNHFWVQLATDTAKIDEMVESLACANSFKKLNDFNPDTTCAAFHSDTGFWFRAKIYESLGEEYEVLLVDYGNIITTKDLRALPVDIETIPPLAVLCSLELPPEVTEWKDFSTSNFNALLAEGSSDCFLEFINKEVPSKVRLYINQKNVSEEILIEPSETALTSESSVNLTSDQVSLLALNTQLPDVDLNLEESEIEECDITETQQENAVDDEIKKAVQIETSELPSVESDNNQIIEMELNQDENDEHLSEQTLNNIQNDKKETEFNKNMGVGNFTNTENIKNLSEMSVGDGKILTDDQTDAFKNSCTLPASKIEDIKTYDDQETNKHFILSDEKVGNLTNTENSENLTSDQVNALKIPSTLPTSNIEETIEEMKTFEEQKTNEHHPMLNDKIVPGSISRGDLESPTFEEIQEIVSIEKLKEEIVANIKSRPATPHNEKIVPGSISRGEEKTILSSDEDEINQLSPVSQNEKIVPGSICRGEEKELAITESEEHLKNSENIETKLPEQLQEAINYPVIPKHEKIVPGSICRGEETIKDSFNDKEEISSQFEYEAIRNESSKLIKSDNLEENDKSK